MLDFIIQHSLKYFPESRHGNAVDLSRPARKHVADIRSELRSPKSLFSSLAINHIISVNRALWYAIN